MLSMNERIAHRLMLGYCVLLTTILAGLCVSQAVSGPSKVTYDEIDVRRINVRESDGTVRMIISGADTAPGVIVKGKEIPHPNRRSAGIIFYNDEGTENGGLIFDGDKKGGQVTNHGHLSFDQYEQDQVVVLEQNEENGERNAGLSFIDRPDAALPFDLLSKENTAEVRAEREKLKKSGGFGHPRLFIGKTDGHASEVSLKDAKGRPRLVIRVTADGGASIDFLDESGKTVRSLTPSPGTASDR
jgi:hypothetical protein